MYLFGYQSETGMTHFTLNDTKSRGKCISRFSLVGAGGGGGGGGGGGEGRGERQAICIRLANHKALHMLSNNCV